MWVNHWLLTLTFICYVYFAKGIMVANSMCKYWFYVWQLRLEIRWGSLHEIAFLSLIKVLPARVKALIATANFLLRNIFLDRNGLVERQLLQCCYRFSACFWQCKFKQTPLPRSSDGWKMPITFLEPNCLVTIANYSSISLWTYSAIYLKF